MNANVAGHLEMWKERVDSYLASYLDGLEPPRRLAEGMRYALLGAGKRFRPLVALASARCVGGVPDTVLPAACSLEMVHSYSLVHDDLPAMDDDELRRGKPTAHVVFGEAQAILIGDALLSEAFALLGDLSRHPGIYAHELLEVCGYLARAIGANGMVGGQLLDIEAQGGETTEDVVKSIHLGKTARLMQASTFLGAKLGGGSEGEIKGLADFGLELGRAYQIADDILAEIGGPERTGKEAGRDRHLRKATAVAVYGVQESKRLATELINSALGRLEPFNDRADVLAGLAGQVLARLG